MSSSGGGGHVASKRKRRISDLTQEEVNEIIALRGKMPQAAVGRRFGIEQTDVSQLQRMVQKGKAFRVDERKRLRDLELVLPIAYGTVAFWLGKKADELHSHSWTAYVRGANDEDISQVVKRVVFQLHPSFDSPTRIVESAPFFLSETGWGEFEIGITIVFHGDASEKPAELSHHLRLYPPEQEGVPQAPPSSKVPVVVESYDEIVFPEPLEAFYLRVRRDPCLQVHGDLAVLAAAKALPEPADHSG